jgi:hypothetical protein
LSSGSLPLSQSSSTMVRYFSRSFIKMLVS